MSSARRESQFSLRVWPLMRLLCSSEYCMPSSIWAAKLDSLSNGEKYIKLRRNEKVAVHLGRVRDRSVNAYVQNTLYTCIKYTKNQ